MANLSNVMRMESWRDLHLEPRRLGSNPYTEERKERDLTNYGKFLRTGGSWPDLTRWLYVDQGPRKDLIITVGDTT